jgi:hypothetical protein
VEGARPALREPSDPEPAVPATAVAAGRITGTKVGVPYAAEAHRILVAAWPGETNPPPPQTPPRGRPGACSRTG